MSVKMTRNQIQPIRMVILTSLQTINAGENWVVMEPTDTVSGNGDCQSPRKYSLHMLEKNLPKNQA